MSHRLREILRASFVQGLESLDLGAAVATAMAEVPLPRAGGSVKVLAVGKAASAMARGALPALGGRTAEVLVIVPDGARPLMAPRRGSAIQTLAAPHPDPDRRSVAAARRALHFVGSAEFVLALVSGGASSLLCLPRGLALSRYVRIVRRLLLAGATVREVNVVRRHLCSVKGGGLGRAALGSVHTLVASDVIGGALHDVGSGPTVPDPTTCAQARAVLRRYAPRLAPPPMRETLKPAARAARRLEGRFVSRPEDLPEAVARRLRVHLPETRVLKPSVASPEDLAGEYAALAVRLRPGEAVARAAEPAIRVDARRPGRGGRSTHLAVLVGRGLPEGVVFLAGASDGVDGSSGTAGAVVDGSLRALASDDAIARSLATFDTAPLLVSAGMAIPLGPTGHNLADVHVLARFSSLPSP